jgi:hypothetical protein
MIALIIDSRRPSSNYSNHRDIFKGRACNLIIIYSANQLAISGMDFDRLWNISALYFQKEIEHYVPIITSEGDITRKDLE